MCIKGVALVFDIAKLFLYLYSNYNAKITNANTKFNSECLSSCHYTSI